MSTGGRTPVLKQVIGALWSLDHSGNSEEASVGEDQLAEAGSKTTVPGTTTAQSIH